MADKLIIKSAEFVKSAVKPEHYPPEGLPEVAFAGRSNVGKSSLINCLVQRKKLVRTSSTPGLTQTINFFIINGTFHLVDLPGYGFAKVPEKVRAQWRPMVESYLNRRKSLRGVVQIIDSRHPPTPDDMSLWQWLQAHRMPALPVLTKVDKLKRSQWSAQLKQAAATLGIPEERFVLFSASTAYGRPELIEKLLDWLEPPPDHSVSPE